MHNDLRTLEKQLESSVPERTPQPMPEMFLRCVRARRRRVIRTRIATSVGLAVLVLAGYWSIRPNRQLIYSVYPETLVATAQPLEPMHAGASALRHLRELPVADERTSSPETLYTVRDARNPARITALRGF